MINFHGNESKLLKMLHPIGVGERLGEILLGILTMEQRWQYFNQSLDNAHSDLEISVPYNAIPTHDWLHNIIKNRGIGDTIPLKLLEYPWQLYQLNEQMIKEDFQWITQNATSASIPAYVQTYGSYPIFIEEGAQLRPCILNTEEGPIYIGRNALIMEGALIRGPFAMLEGSVVKMGAKIYKGTTLGAYTVAGGEIKNVLMMSYSNKAHDGYLGDAVIGSWCNLGAGTSNSNIKNTASLVSHYYPYLQKFMEVGQKAGLILGSYSKTAIHTSFNTGTVVGAVTNVFGSGLTPQYIPDFSWGFNPSKKYHFEKAIEHIKAWKKLKNKPLTEKEIQDLRGIFETS